MLTQVAQTLWVDLRPCVSPAVCASLQWHIRARVCLMESSAGEKDSKSVQSAHKTDRIFTTMSMSPIDSMTMPAPTSSSLSMKIRYLGREESEARVIAPCCFTSTIRCGSNVSGCFLTGCGSSSCPQHHGAFSSNTVETTDTIQPHMSICAHDTCRGKETTHIWKETVTRRAQLRSFSVCVDARGHDVRAILRLDRNQEESLPNVRGCWTCFRLNLPPL